MNIKSIVLTIIVAIIVGIGVYFYKSRKAEITLPFPYATSIDPAIGLSCEAIVGSFMYGENTREKKITAELFVGTDKISIELDSEGRFNFLTKASFETGETKSSENWEILQNNKNFLVARLSKFGTAPIHNFEDIVYLNKENGTGLWVKTSATSLFSDTPEVQTYLLKCM